MTFFRTFTVALLVATAAACTSAAPDPVEAAPAELQQQAKPVRHVTRVSCKDAFTGQPLGFDVYSDGERTMRALLLGRFTSLGDPPTELALVPRSDLPPGASFGGSDHVVFRAPAGGPSYVMSAAIAHRLSIYTEASLADSALTVVDASGFPTSLHCTAAPPSSASADGRTALENVLPRGELRGRTPDGQSCSVHVEVALPIEITPDMPERTREVLAGQREQLVVRLRKGQAAPSVGNEASYFVVGSDAHVLASPSRDVVSIDALYSDAYGPSASMRRSLVVDRLEGGHPRYRVAIGFPAHDEIPLDICDTDPTL